MSGVSGVAVAKVILDQPEIMAPVRQGEAAGVSAAEELAEIRAGFVPLSLALTTRANSPNN